jgi:hypothetical protein
MSRPVSASPPRSAVRQLSADVSSRIVQPVSAGTATTVMPQLCGTRRGTGGAVRIMRIERRRITRSVAKLARTRRSLRHAAAGPAREALADLGSDASKDQRYALDEAHTTKGMTAQ